MNCQQKCCGNPYHCGRTRRQHIIPGWLAQVSPEPTHRDASRHATQCEKGGTAAGHHQRGVPPVLRWIQP